MIHECAKSEKNRIDNISVFLIIVYSEWIHVLVLLTFEMNHEK